MNWLKYTVISRSAHLGLAFLGLFAGGACAWSHPLDVWQVRYSGTNGLRGVSFGGGLFVSVGDRGVILSSTSGETWTSRNSGTRTNLYDIAYGGGKFIAVGESGTIVSSPDGTNWTAEESGVTNSLWSICYGNGRFVAGSLSAYGFVLTSVNGKDWSSQQGGPVWIHSPFVFGNGLFLVHAASGTLLVSSDGTNWFPRPSASTSFYTVSFGEGLFVWIDQQNRVFSSADGSNWVQRGSVAVMRPSALAYGNGHFVVGGGGSLEYSPDTTKWTVSPTGYLYVTWDVAFGHDTFVAVASDGLTGTIKQSDPLVTWLRSSAPGILELFGPTGKSYNVECTDAPMTGAGWTTLTNFTLATSPQVWTDHIPSGHPTRFYRAVMQP